MRLWNYIKENMLKYPKQLVCESKAKMKFSDLVVWAETFAEKLEGIKSCAILCNSEMAQGMAILACFAAGVTAIPLSARYGDVHCRKIMDAIDPEAIITDDNGDFHIYKLPNFKYIEPQRHPAVIMCTSGTTGEPKGVMLGENSIISNVTDILSYFMIDNSDTILISRPIYHCAVLTGEFIASLVSGVKIRFYSGQFNPAKVIELVDQYNVTVFCGTPTLLEMMARFNRGGKRSSLKHICISGECMEREQGRRIAESFPESSIYHVYGLTEACPRVSYLPPALFNEYPDCVGFPLRSVSSKLLKNDGAPAATGEEGMLWVKGENVMLGYYNNPSKTSKVLKDGWLCTGDIALINEMGLLKIKGRNDHLIIKSGMNIYPAEVESAIRTDIRVREVMVYGFKNKYGMQLGMKIAGDFSSVDEVKRLCSSCLPSFQIPTRIDIVDELPKSASGKILRNI